MWSFHLSRKDLSTAIKSEHYLKSLSDHVRKHSVTDIFTSMLIVWFLTQIPVGLIPGWATPGRSGVCVPCP